MHGNNFHKNLATKHDKFHTNIGKKGVLRLNIADGSASLLYLLNKLWLPFIYVLPLNGFILFLLLSLGFSH